MSVITQQIYNRVACPKCGAPQGSPCVGAVMHRQRQRAAGWPGGSHHNRAQRDYAAIRDRACPLCHAPAGTACESIDSGCHSERRSGAS